ncbi:PD-(D/E)XK nuclease family protein [Natroniella acetigena]|uniref:PD-(D/E)XK nuclease family protein n=1 Tax=Natroniella acetigena TaxID=52004 RepID=UPI00200A29C5|nr:PD-(D/E)XK nuclease family protein [Natroniella acetigena]MCK8827364.1 PD-(D/E)XK nuclease family protein [Natroniella acetigena]
MNRAKLKELYFSKSALATYEQCPLRFRRRYLDGLYWGRDWGMEQEERTVIEQGILFHDLANRYYRQGKMLVDKELLTDQMVEWLESLINYRPYLEGGTFLPEQEFRINQAGLRILAKFDLLYITPEGKAIIYEWKTSPKPTKQLYRRKAIQTKVYRYVLCKAGGSYSPTGCWKPEDIQMIYWNPRFKKEQVISYTEEQFKDDQELLISKIKQIEETKEFIATSDQEICARCEYSPVCHGEPAIELEVEEEDLDLDFDWESIDQFQF